MAELATLMKNLRKIIQIVVLHPSGATSSGYDTLYALCDDGSLWIRANFTDWERVPGPPVEDAVEDPEPL